MNNRCNQPHFIDVKALTEFWIKSNKKQFEMRSVHSGDTSSLQLHVAQLSMEIITHYHTMPHSDAIKIYTTVENMVRKGAIACKQKFLLSQCFLPYMALIFHAL